MTEFEPMKIFENDSLLCGQYRIIATLSATIAGTVYLCQDETTGENVVLRHLPSASIIIFSGLRSRWTTC